MIKIGLTGGIGSGKSYICRLFEEFGVSVYNADSRAKDLMITDQMVVDAIKCKFGDASYNNDGSLNRFYLAESVFSDREKLAVLNSIVHPTVLADFSRFVKECEETGCQIVMMEAAVLIESGFHQFMDKIIVVSAHHELRMKRTMLRDNVQEQNVKNRMLAQMNDREREKYADFVIINNEKELLIPQILEILNSF